MKVRFRNLGLPLILFALTSCSNIFFYPTKQTIVTPKEIGLGYKEFLIHGKNEPQLHCWFIPSKGQAKGTVIHYHGNAQNMSNHFASVYWLPLFGYNLITFDYRGYGQSKGSTSLAGIVRDAERILEFAVSLPAPYYHQNIILWGQSLGGALVLVTSATSKSRDKIKMVIAEAPFDSFPGIFQQKAKVTWLTRVIGYPLALTIPSTYDPEIHIKKIALPILFIHANDDPIVPLVNSLHLYDLANHPKELWIIPSDQHIDVFTTPGSRLALVNKISAQLTRTHINR